MDVPEAEGSVLEVSEVEASHSLGRLLDRVRDGQRVVLTRDGTAVAELTAVPPMKTASSATKPRDIHGIWKGKVWIADDFDELGPEWDPYIK